MCIGGDNGRFCIATKACKLVREEFANEISVLIVQQTLNLAGVEACVK